MKKHQNQIKDYFCLIGSTVELTNFVANFAGLSRHNLSNELHHERNKNVANQVFGFHVFEEALLCAKSFFEEIEMEFPKSCH